MKSYTIEWAIPENWNKKQLLLIEAHKKLSKGDLINNYVYYVSLKYENGIILERIKPIFVGHNI